MKGWYTRTVKQRITSVIASEGISMETDSIDKLIYLAYYMGRESATKQVSDRYADHIKAQKSRASKCRYHNLAAQVVGPENFLYSGDYSGEMVGTFGSDETNF